jgi:hypothetical protein
MNSASTANEFVGLDLAMGGDGTNRSGASTYSLFTGTSAAVDNWLGVFSGQYIHFHGGGGLSGQNGESYYWLSTANDTTSTYVL